MDKMIKDITSAFMKPFMDQFRNRYMEELVAVSLKKGGIPKPPQQLEIDVEKGCEEVRNFLLAKEEIDRMEKGFETVIKELENLSNKEDMLQDFKQAAIHLNAESGDSDEFELHVYDTIQQMFGLHDKTIETMYQIASRLYNTHKKEEALNVLILVTTLNNFVFEPWLGLGSCWLFFKRYGEALQAFTMATLINFNHPAPHIYSAECYLALGKNIIAKETLQLGLSLMDSKQKRSFKGHIDYLNNQLFKGEKHV